MSHAPAARIGRLPPPSAPQGLALWLLSRSTMGLVLATLCLFVREDVSYYATQLEGASLVHRHCLGRTLVEYPVPVVWVLELPRVLSGAPSQTYVHAFALVMVAIDAGCCWALWSRRGRSGALVWIAFTVLIGPLLWFRIDLIPAACILMAVLLRDRHPLAAGAGLGIGAAMKLWPALLVLLLVGPDRAGRRRGLGFAVSGGLAAAASCLLEGWTRSASPLAWQSGRGLQIESVWASPLMAARVFSDTWHVRLSRYNAYEIFGPGTQALARAAACSMLAVALLCLVLGWLIGLGGAGLPGHRLSSALAPGRRRDRELAVLLGLVTVICAVIVTDKTFSPQYMIWLAGPLAVLSTVPLRRRDRRQVRALVALALCCAALTQLVFPLNYSSLVSAGRPGAVVSALLVARNLLMCALTCHCLVLTLSRAWRLGLPGTGQLASSTQSDEEEPQR